MPGSNAIETAEAIKAKMEELKSRFPAGVEYRIVYDTTVFVKESITSVYHTLIEAFILVFIVVLVFLQNWRATIIPMVAVPVSLIGTFAVMAMLGFSLNNLSLFGLVLAIGIVVDDAIVVVENVERLLAEGLSPRDASRKAMDEVTGPVIAIALVLCAVFVPTAFMAGISGQFYRQFALTIAASTIISAFNSLTLSPALGCATAQHLMAHGHGHADASAQTGHRHHRRTVGHITFWPGRSDTCSASVAASTATAMPARPRCWGLTLGLYAVGIIAGYLVSKVVNTLLGGFFKGFNKAFDIAINAYGKTVAGMLRLAVIVLLVYGGLIALTLMGVKAVPKGFIPDQDKGYLVLNAQLPDGSALGRTDAVIKRLSEIARKTEGVAYTIDMPGYSTLLSTNISNVGGMFIILKPFEERAGNSRTQLQCGRCKNCASSSREIMDAKHRRLRRTACRRAGQHRRIQAAGPGQTRRRTCAVLAGAVQNLASRAARTRHRGGLFTSFSVSQPQLFVDIDREKAKAAKISLDDINRTLQSNLGSFYVNDFTFQNRNWQVNVQADPSASFARGRHRRAGSPQRQRRSRAAANADRRPQRQRARRRESLQPLSVRRDQRQRRARRQLRPEHRDHGPTLATSNSLPRWAMNGPS